MMKRLLFVALALCLASLAFAGEKEHAKGEKKGCAMTASAEHDHSKACPMKDKAIAGRSEVTMTGKLLCMHCNLQKEEKCRKVFQSADNAEKLYTICPSSKIDVEKLSEEGAATVKINGELVKAEDGTEILMISSGEKLEPAA